MCDVFGNDVGRIYVLPWGVLMIRYVYIIGQISGKITNRPKGLSKKKIRKKR